MIKKTFLCFSEKEHFFKRKIYDSIKEQFLEHLAAIMYYFIRNFVLIL